MSAESRKAYVLRARAARIKQGLPEHIEDPATLNFLAEVMARAAPTTSERASPHKT